MNENNIAIYIRLSNADEDTGKNKDESNSIVNQRSLIHRYLNESGELSHIPRFEFVDDGFSGTNMDRPAFQNMISQIKAGKFSICITKDFSRFTRDYIEMGDYLECLFPFLRVRYISINDNYDSNDYFGTTGGIDVVMRNIVYDAYSKDLSAKIKMAHIQNAKKGLRGSGYPGFGYMPNPANKKLNIIDPEAAAIVRKIFDAAISGKQPAEIADMLNSEHIITPGMYFRKKHPGTAKFAHTSEKHQWEYSTVRQILDRYAYTGASVSMMRDLVSPCSKHSIKNPREKWIVVPGMHEAIVSIEEFEMVQELLIRNRKSEKTIHHYPLKSLMVCGICGRKLQRQKETSKKPLRFNCKYGNIECKEVFSPSEEELHKIIYDGIMDFIHLTDETSRKIDRKKSSLEKRKNNFDVWQRNIERRKRDILAVYEKYAKDGISKEKFLSKKAALENDIQKLEKNINDLKYEIEHCSDSINVEWEANCKMFRDAKELTYEMSHAFVDKIVIYPDQRMEIKWKFCQY